MIHSEAFDLLMGAEQDEADHLAGLQQLVDSGNAWTLEGSVGRGCMAAIEDGAIVLGPTDHRDFWGNHVPSRFQVKSGTKGSAVYAHDLHRGELGHSRGISASCPKCKAWRDERPDDIAGLLRRKEA